MLGVSIVMASAVVGRDRMRASLTAVSSLLGGGHDLGGFVAWGDALGAPVTFAFVSRPAGAGTERWTEIEVKLPARYPLVLRLRRHAPHDRERVERGELIDVDLGDRAFDRAFLLEAAPVDVVKLLLDDKVRAYLLRRDHVELSTQVAEGAVLKLAVRGWLEKLAEAQPAIETAVDLAIGVREAYARVEEESLLGMGGAPFRPEPDARLTRRAAEEREAEVHRLERLHRTRNRSS